MAHKDPHPALPFLLAILITLLQFVAYRSLQKIGRIYRPQPQEMAAKTAKKPADNHGFRETRHRNQHRL